MLAVASGRTVGASAGAVVGAGGAVEAVALGWSTAAVVVTVGWLVVALGGVGCKAVGVGTGRSGTRVGVPSGSGWSVEARISL